MVRFACPQRGKRLQVEMMSSVWQVRYPNLPRISAGMMSGTRLGDDRHLVR